VWTRLEGAVRRQASDVRVDIAIFKAIVTLAALASAWLIWTILGDVAPRLQLTATLLYLWNPAVLVELAGEGHNDALIVCCVLLSLLLWIRRRHFSSGLAIGIALLIKIAAPFVAPLELLHAWRSGQLRGALAARLAAAGAVVLGLAAIAYAPFWI